MSEPTKPLTADDRAMLVMDSWEAAEGESMRDAHHATMRNLIAEQIRLAVEERDREWREGLVDLDLSGLRAEVKDRDRRIAELEQIGRDYVALTDPLVSCSAWLHGGENDPKCGTCRGCALDRVEELEREIERRGKALAEAAEELGEVAGPIANRIRVYRGEYNRAIEYVQRENTDLRADLSRTLACLSQTQQERDTLREALIESNLRRCGMCGCFPIADEPHAINCLVDRALAPPQPPSEAPEK